MEPFARLAQFTCLRDASFVALAGVTLMVAFSFVPRFALALGAAVALGHAVVLVLRAVRLTPARVLVTEPWRALYSDQQAALAEARDWACAYLARTQLAFARGAAAVAVGLSSLSLLVGIAERLG